MFSHVSTNDFHILPRLNGLRTVPGYTDLSLHNMCASDHKVKGIGGCKIPIVFSQMLLKSDFHPKSDGNLIFEFLFNSWIAGI